MGAPKQPSQITQTNKTELGPEQKAVFAAAQPYIDAYAASPLPQLFGGSTIAGFNPNETAAQNYATGVVAPAGAELSGRASATQMQLMDPNFMLNPNQYVHSAADAVTKRTTDNLLETILPQLRGGAQVAGGMYSGGATKAGVAEGLAAGKTSDAISMNLADMYLKNYTQGLSTMANQVNANPGVMQGSLFPATVMSAVGGQQRAMEQAKLDEEVRKFYTQQPGEMELAKAQQMLGLISGMPGATGVSTVTGAQPQQNTGMQMLGMGLTGLSALSSLGPMMALK